MTPFEFIRTWSNSSLKERGGAQEHFIDLCRMLGELSPAAADPSGKDYAFEYGAAKTTGGKGFADVFKRGHFGWEYKGTHANLDRAFEQLQRYAVALDNPPLLVVSDIGTRIRIHTNWTNSVSKTYEIQIAELEDPEKRGWLKSLFSDPDALRPKKTRQQLTSEIAGDFADLAVSLGKRHRGDPGAVAHFINKLVFCMFAEDVRLLRADMFKNMLDRAMEEPTEFETFAGDLFRAMRTGGRVGFERIPWFNGGLFDDDHVFALNRDEIKLVHSAASHYWGDIDPSILGTMFERGLDPEKRSQLGAHYTDRDKIMAIVGPVVERPLMAEWENARAEIRTAYEIADEARKRKPATQAQARKVYMTARRQEETAKRNAVAIFEQFLLRLRNFRVLDPACGSGNFLFLALKTLKDIEHRVILDMEALSASFDFPYAIPAPSVGPENVLGIEINPYAAELARVSVWIGEIQWMLRHGFSPSRDPILKPLATIECRDALLDEMGPPTEDGRMFWTGTSWPAADAIIGNPPFLGAKLLKRRLGTAKTDAIRRVYDGRLPGFTDLVCYWFENARQAVEAGTTKRVGLVATNSIRKNTNLPVMHRIVEVAPIFAAWPEEKWVVDGAMVDVSLVCFGESDGARTLAGTPVDVINADLSTGLDMTAAGPLPENRDGAFLGIQKSGPFDVPGAVAREWMLEPTNPNGRENAEVLKPYWNGDDVTGRPRDVWFIDLPAGLSETDASLYPSAFRHISTTPDDEGALIKDLRSKSGSHSGTYPWWQPWRPRPEMRSRIERLPRYIVTPETAQHRIFVWLSYPVLPDKNLIVIPRDDDLMFGLLHSRHHRIWSLRKGSDLQDRPRYTHTSTFATFPFPEGMSPDIPATRNAGAPEAEAIADAARILDERRAAWLYPANSIRTEPEVVPGFPHRRFPIDEAAAQILSRRTMTALYNEAPPWLANAHAVLDAAVAAAYGWPADLSDDEILGRLFDLNQARATAGVSSDR